MERVCGRRDFGWYFGGAGLIFLAWLAEPSLRGDLARETAGLPLIFYLLAAGCCLAGSLFGPDRMWAAARGVLAVLSVASQARWLPLWLDLSLLQVVLGCLAMAFLAPWLEGRRSLVPPTECALAVAIAVAGTIALTVFMPGETLLAIARLAETSLALIFFCWCASLTLVRRAAVAAFPEPRCEVITPARPNPTARPCFRPPVRRRGPVRLGKAA